MKTKTVVRTTTIVVICLLATSLCAAEIHDAASDGDLTRMTQLVEVTPSLVNATNDRNCTPLHYAVSNGHMDIATLLLHEDAEINARDVDGDTPLHWAAEIGRLDMIELLISEHANINQANNSGWPPIYWAIARNHSTAVTALINAGASVDIISGDNQTLLAAAVDGGNPEIVNTLISIGADINFEYADGNSLLHRSIVRGRYEVGRVLLENGIDPNSQNRLGLSPLHIASVSGDAAAIELLLAHNADASVVTIDGGTPLDFAKAAGHISSIDILKADQAGDHTWAFPPITGEYLGQPRPGLEIEAFTPGIVLYVYRAHGGLSSTNKGKEMYWVRNCPSFQKVWYTKENDGKWTYPQPASFNSDVAAVGDEDPFVSPDGKRLFFSSNRPLEDGGEAGNVQRIWYTERSGEYWGKPQLLEIDGIDESWDMGGASVSKSGSIYFHIDYRNQEGGFVADIYRVTDSNGVYSKPKKLGESINSPYVEAKPYISPNEDYLIFSSHRPEGGIMLTFGLADGSWSEPKCISERLGSHIISVQGFSSDGRYLFLNGVKDGIHNYYWVEAKIIEDLRLEELK